MSPKKKRIQRRPRPRRERSRRPHEPKRKGPLAIIEQTARSVVTAAEDHRLPFLDLPSRTLSNVRYDPKVGYFELGPRTKRRTLGARTAKTFAQTLRLMALSKEVVENGDFATKREAYYVSKNWGDCRFAEQTESDGVLEDLEALASRHGVFREELGFVPEEHGGSVVGGLVVREPDPETGRSVTVDCRRLGTGAYTVPRSVETLELESDAEFVLAIETGGMFQRLHTHRFWREHRCILVELAGVPSRATRRFVRRLSEDLGLPLYCFVDCDPYGIANIYRTLKVGSGSSAHVNRFFAAPKARFLGVTPQDIIDFHLEDATHPLQARDVKRAEDALRNDPFFRAHPRWRTTLEQMLAMGVRAEQQALAKWGLNFVIDEYLPRKLAEPGSFLP
jgi:DNA topoisomerase-6 subunit A